MTSLGLYVLSLILSTFPPGRKPSSVERLSQCGTDPSVAACAIAPVCPRDMTACATPPVEAHDGPQCCALPRWLEGVGWVRTETREVGAKRLEGVAQALADAALHLGAAWEPGPRDLARAMLSAGGWSNGLSEGVQVGRIRGPAGEVCFMDLRIDTLRSLVPWERSRLPAEELAQSVLGLEYEPTRRCFDAGALLLVRARREAERRCKGYPIDYATFALYATGSRCTTGNMLKPDGSRGDWLAGPRTASLGQWRSRKGASFPDWYAPPTASDP